MDITLYIKNVNKLNNIYNSIKDLFPDNNKIFEKAFEYLKINYNPELYNNLCELLIKKVKEKRKETLHRRFEVLEEIIEAPIKKIIKEVLKEPNEYDMSKLDELLSLYEQEFNKNLINLLKRFPSPPK